MNLKLEKEDAETEKTTVPKSDEENSKKEENKIPPREKKDQKELRKKLLSIMAIIIGALIVILLIVFIGSLLFKKKYSYVEVEDIMKKAAINYYQDHKGRLPQDNETVEAVDDSLLVRDEYMKPLNKYLKDDVNCIGKVEVDYNNGDYIYTPYLECGKAYSTTELYKHVMEKEKIVAQGYGLYNMNNEYVYRGENVKNYIALDDNSIWRIVKFTETGEAVLAYAGASEGSDYIWDNRYNNAAGENYGFSNYGISRMKDELKQLYVSEEEEERILTKKAREKLVAFDLCVGKRAVDYIQNDNSAECSVTEPNQMIGLLTLSDYLNASTDPNCISPLSRSCQNYNYLVIKKTFWLVTPVDGSDYQVYRAFSSGYVLKTETNDSYYVRPVVHLSSKAMYKSGKGTESNPYKIR